MHRLRLYALPLPGLGPIYGIILLIRSAILHGLFFYLTGISHQIKNHGKTVVWIGKSSQQSLQPFEDHLLFMGGRQRRVAAYVYPTPL